MVAQEIGKLTGSSKDATANITAIIETMKQHIANISEIMGALDKICRQQTQVAVSLEEDNQFHFPKKGHFVIAVRTIFNYLC